MKREKILEVVEQVQGVAHAERESLDFIRGATAMLKAFVSAYATDRPLVTIGYDAIPECVQLVNVSPHHIYITEFGCIGFVDRDGGKHSIVSGDGTLSSFKFSDNLFVADLGEAVVAVSKGSLPNIRLA